MTKKDEMKRRVLGDLRNHKMKIEQDDGVHRCIYFGRPGRGIYSFRLVTWPGALAIQGDCGNFMFSRLTDMFEFFRSDDGEINISSGYWAEKLISIGKHERLMVFSPEKFNERVMHDFKHGWQFETGDDHDRALVCLADEYDGLFGDRFDDARSAIEAATGYECPVTGNGFSDAWEWRVEEYGFQYLWACHAIVWGIKRYDQHKSGRTQADHDARMIWGKAA